MNAIFFLNLVVKIFTIQWFLLQNLAIVVGVPFEQQNMGCKYGRSEETLNKAWDKKLWNMVYYENNTENSKLKELICF